MIITCKECNANFKLDESLLKSTGSKVRCSKCNEIFVAYPPKISEEEQTPTKMALDTEDQQITEDFETAKKEPTDPDELDFSDMDKLIDEEVAEEDTADEDTEELELDIDLDVEPETESAKEDLETEVDQAESDELDLSDLENLLDEKEEAVSESKADETVDELELDIEPAADGPTEKSPPSAESEELDELDLSDLEEILDLDEPTTEEESEPDDIVLELDMETEPELEKAQEAGEAEDLEEVDLSEIEKMLEVEEETESEEEAPEKELDLKLDMEEEPSDAELAEDSSQVEVYELDEADDTVDESEALEDAVTVDETEAAETAETKERKPEFEVGESKEREQVEEDVVEEEPLIDEEPAPAKEKRVSKPLVVLLILVLLAGGSYGTYVLLDFLNIEIPYISDYLKPKVSDPTGSLKIDTLDVNSKFLLNVKEGKLFVITGRVKNGYSEARSFIKINGKLYTKGKILSQTETVFCGNVLSDIELSNLELEAIKKRLSNRLGDNKSNMQVKPGGELPFMIIFSNLPEDLEEFSIEVASSMPATG